MAIVKLTCGPELYYTLTKIADRFSKTPQEFCQLLHDLNFRTTSYKGQEWVQFEAGFVTADRFLGNELARVWIAHDMWREDPLVQERWKEKDLFEAGRLLPCGDSTDDDPRAARAAEKFLMLKNRLLVRP